MNGVVSQFHRACPAYAKTQVKVVWVPWTSRATEWTTALSSGKNAPDITELGNTDTPTEASLGMLANIGGNVGSSPEKSEVVTGMLANDTQNGNVYAVPWFGGLRARCARKTQFTPPRTRTPPTPR